MNFIKRNYLKILYIIISISLILYAISYFGSLNISSSKSFLLVALLMIALVISTAIVLIKFNSKEIYKQFCVIALIWGVAFIFINPPFLVPDEFVHSYRAYDIAEGRLLYKANEDNLMLPSGLQEYRDKVFDLEKNGITEYINIMKIDLNKGEKIKYNADSTGAYNAIAYVPQSIGIFIGDILNLPVYFVLVLGRITNLLVWIGICLLSLKIIPIKKDLMMLIMLIPVGLQQAASLSPDVLLNSSSFMLISYILYLKFEKDKVKCLDVVIIALLTIFIGSVKIPYIAIAGLLILIPNKKIKFKIFGKALLLMLVITVNLLLMIGWSKVSKAPKVANDTVVVQSNETSNAQGMGVAIKKIINEPTVFISKVGETLEAAESFYKRTFTAYFGWFKVLAPDAFVTTILLVLILFALKGDNTGYILNIFDRVVFLALACGMYLVLCAVVLQWTSAEISQLAIFDGIQGRYFIPFILGVYLVFQNNKLKIKIDKFWGNSYRNLYICWTLAFSLVLIFTSYFII